MFLLSLNFVKAFLCRKEVIATSFGDTQAHMEEWGVGRHKLSKSLWSTYYGLIGRKVGAALQLWNSKRAQLPTHQCHQKQTEGLGR